MNACCLVLCRYSDCYTKLQSRPQYLLTMKLVQPLAADAVEGIRNVFMVSCGDRSLAIKAEVVCWVENSPVSGW